MALRACTCVRARVSSYTRVLENEDALSCFVCFFVCFLRKRERKKMHGRIISLYK